MLKYKVIVLRSFKLTIFFAKFEKMAIAESNMIFKYNFSTKKRNCALKNDQCRPKIGMVVVINVLNKNINRFIRLHAFYPCLNAQTLLTSQLMSFLTDFEPILSFC